MATYTPEQRALGQSNANVALGMTRRDLLRGAAAAPALGAFYFGYGAMDGKNAVRAAIIGTGDEGCQAMIRYHNRAYVNYIGYCDIRPSQQERAVKEFQSHRFNGDRQYSDADVAKLKNYSEYQDALKDPDVEMIVIALPLWLHAPVAIEALQAGKHVFCEKLMAHTIGQCKAMCRVARKSNRLLAIGHQRHYSVLYDNANYLVQNGFLGEIRHIRALWHRNNGQPRIKKENGKLVYDSKGEPVFERDDKGNVLYFDSWKKDIPEADRNVDWMKHGYKSLDELVRWRLYNRTGAGLMAELGSHQLDACSIFLGKRHPLAVTGVGGTYYYKDGREVDDHVFCTFEFPGKDETDRVIMTYSSITTNGFEKYGETVMGTLGTLVVEEEKEMMLYKEVDRNTWKPGDPANARTTNVTIGANPAGKPTVEASPSLAGPTAASSLAGASTSDPSRGYREELEHFAYCIRHGDKANYHEDKQHQPRCRGEVALADAVVALSSNLAMRQQRRIEFDSRWFEANDDAVPDKSEKDLSLGAKA